MSTLLVADAPKIRGSTKLECIVCGTDFSVQAQEAANVAAALARRTGATLVLVHAHEATAPPNDPAALRDASVGARRQLVAERQRLREFGVEVREKFTEGAPLDGLRDALRSEKPDLLVISSRGQVTPLQFVRPGVAERTAENSPVPILVVRGDEAFRNWVNGIAPLKVLLAYDFSSTADDALDWLRRLCGIGPCEVTVAYAAYPPQESWRLGIGEHAWLDALPLEIQRLVQRDIEERVTEVLDGTSFKVRVEPAWGRADPLLLSLAKEAGADLIVVGTHQRNGFGRFWLGSVSRAILRDSMCSVAIVPRSPARAESIQSIPTIRRVLVPTDFSDLGNRAIRHAYSLLPDGGTVCLVHVNIPGGVDGSAHARLRALVPPDSDAHGIATIVDVAESDRPAEAICQAAERFGADVVCIASHGRTGMSKMFMGSVAQEVISRTSRLLLIVRAQ